MLFKFFLYRFFKERFLFSISVQRKYKRLIITIGWKRNYVKRAEDVQTKLPLEDKSNEGCNN